ncbi:copper resistance CopC family protein [Actinomadura rudentiformis]|uniref:copper resistance CopC family protein n=1 Tax=Actinomadura rudentiformis TaxID=359158 RepID=UPI00178C2158|nr:copper resistance CopC family protein [Actinomadura rudentiformis]
MRGTAKALTVLAISGGTVALAAAPAASHAELTSISPDHRSTQTSSPSQVVLTFNQSVNKRFTVIRVTGPGGERAESGSAVVSEEVARQGLMPLSRPGRYQVAYRTVSVDGHVISGSRAFTFQPAASGSASTAAPSPLQGADMRSATSLRASESNEPSSSGTTWVQIGLGAVVVCLLVGGVLAVRRGRQAGR